jgi:hypothetical protein
LVLSDLAKTGAGFEWVEEVINMRQEGGMFNHVVDTWATGTNF